MAQERHLVLKNVAIIVVGCLFLLISGLVLFLRAPSPPALASIETLLLDSSSFPEWRAKADEIGGASGQFADDNNLENITRQFQSAAGNIATQDLWRYNSTSDARDKYEAILRQYHEYWGWDISQRNGSRYDSHVATRITIFCLDPSDPVAAGGRPHFLIHTMCYSIAQYDTYVSEFTVYIDDQSITYADFDRLLARIDQKMPPAS